VAFVRSADRLLLEPDEEVAFDAPPTAANAAAAVAATTPSGPMSSVGVVGEGVEPSEAGGESLKSSDDMIRDG
jgi:hypothetical protein